MVTPSEQNSVYEWDRLRALTRVAQSERVKELLWAQESGHASGPSMEKESEPPWVHEKAMV